MKKFLSIFFAAVMIVGSCGTGMAAYASLPTDVSYAQIEFGAESYTYTGKKIEPALTVKMNGAELVKDTDYTVQYTKNINAGTATATVTGAGIFEGTKSADFTISPADMNDGKFKYVRTKKATIGVAPEFDVIFDGKTLVKGTDYTTSVSNIDAIGPKVGTMKFIGKGNFTGTYEMKINVFPSAIEKPGVKTRNTTSLTLKWNATEGEKISGYKVYSCDKNGRNTKLLTTVKKNSATVKNLTAGDVYGFMVVAYTNVNGSRLNSENGKVLLTATKPKKVNVESATKVSGGTQIRVKWNKVSCSGYEILYSTDKEVKKNVKTVKVRGENNGAKNIKIKKTGKSYYVKVRAYRTYGTKPNVVRSTPSVRVSTNYDFLYSAYASHYVNKPNRINNLKVACKTINGTVIQPGEVFSFNQVVGPRTRARGYLEAGVYLSPTEAGTGLGGGVCQVASTIFNVVLLGNLETVERHQHIQKVHYGVLGRDAAISYGSQDYKFRNNTNQPIKIKMWCENQCIHCAFYTKKNVKPKKVHLKVAHKGKHYKLTRTVGGEVNYTAHSYY